MSDSPFIHRRTALGILCTSFAGGCLPVPETGPQPHAEDQIRLTDGATTAAVDQASPSAPNESRLKQALEDALDLGFRRGMSVESNGAWQVLHGVLAYGQQCVVDTAAGLQPVIPYLMQGGHLNGWDPMIGDLLPIEMFPEAQRPALESDPELRRGLRFELEPGSMSGQGHTDQWLAVLVQSRIPASTLFEVADRQLSLEAAFLQALWQVSDNEHYEYSWTIIAACALRPTQFRWMAKDATEWSVERLLRLETEQTLEMAACGGTHRLIGLAMALNTRRTEGSPFTEVWKAAEDRVRTAIESSKQYQNDDGSFSTTFLHGFGWSPDMADVLRTTGHVLEVLAVAGDQELLRADWVERAAFRLCHVLKVTEQIPLECGALYHALHGVMLYREKRFPETPWQPPRIA